MKLSDIYGWDGALQKRFWSKVEKTEGCWNWKGAKSSSNYGAVMSKRIRSGEKKSLTAHRVAYLLTHFTVPDDLDVCHSCDNRVCVNPNHLWLGTRQQNIIDAVVKGRINHAGEHNGRALLTQEQVEDIRCRYEKGRGFYHRGNSMQLAKEFGTSGSAIRNVVSGRRWKGA